MKRHDRRSEPGGVPAREPTLRHGARAFGPGRRPGGSRRAVLRHGARGLLVLLVAAVAGCFSEHRSPTDPAPEVTCADVPPEGRTGPNPVVVIRNFAFHPEELSVAEGTTVTWINCEDPGTTAHTTTSDTGAWDSGLLGSGGEDVFTRTFDDAGDYPYHCTPHPFMTGRVVVGS